MIHTPTPIQEINTPYDVKLMIKRDDLIHPEIMGNKWRKLKYNLKQAKNEGKSTLLTFGGAFSNHIAATAAAARDYGFRSIGIIRGDELTADNNLTLQRAAVNGMQFQFITRDEYRTLRSNPKSLQSQYPNAYILPEGGTNDLAIKGAAEIVAEIDQDFDFLVCPIGTGGTMAGILKNLPVGKKAIGISSLRGTFIHDEFQQLLKEHAMTQTNYEILDQYHFGGYAKTTQQLFDFINEFGEQYGIPLDPVYTGKMMFAVMDLIKSNFFEPRSKIICVHTGGLQGIGGFSKKGLKKIL